MSDAIETLRRMPAQVAEVLAGLPPEARSWKPSPRQFSILENVAHLHDLERKGYLVRLRRTLEEETPLLPDLDGDRMAIERRYNSRDLEVELAAFAEARAETVALLARTLAAMRTRRARLEKVGEVTFDRLIEMLIEHDRGHLEEITTLRKSWPDASGSLPRN